MAKRQFDLIVFDWDGTLMDSTAAIVLCIQAAAQDLGLPVPSNEDAAHVIGLGLHEAMQSAMPGMDASLYPRMVERYRHHYLRRGDDLILFKGVPEMLEDLAQQGYFLAVATGKSRAGLNRVLHQVGLLSTFHATRCADETFSKPHPAMLQELTRELGQDMARTVMIGDTSHDLLMAQNAGAAGIAAQYGAHPLEKLSVCQPLFCARNVPHLHQWLNTNA